MFYLMYNQWTIWRWLFAGWNIWQKHAQKYFCCCVDCTLLILTWS